MSDQDDIQSAKVENQKDEENENHQQKIQNILKNFIGVRQQVNKIPLATFYVHDKELHYVEKSLYVLDASMKIRSMAVWTIEWKWFERFIITIILFNTIMLALQDYSFRETNSDAPESWKDNLEYFFTTIFIIEFVLKIVGMGFVLGPNTYLRDGWNLIDFVVVVTGVISFFVSARFSAIRVIRIIRPLRSINSLKQMRVLVATLLDSLPALGNVVIFLLFIVILFGILGLQIFMGALESRCRLTPQPVNGVWTVSSYPKLCSDDSNCPTGTYCGNPQTAGLPQQEDFDESLNYGYTNFENIISATFSIFQALTTEGWTVLIQIYAEAVSPVIVYIYFILLIFIGSFFVVNLILAVINESFLNASEHSSLRLTSLPQEGQPLLVTVQANSLSVLPEIQTNSQINKFRLFQKYLAIIIERKEFLIFITVIILLNTVTLSLDRYPISDEESMIWDIFNQIFTAIFCLELSLKLLAYDINFVRDQMNIFDAVIVILSIVEWILSSQGNNASGGSFSAIQAFRTLRLFRLFKLARTWVSFRKLLAAIAATIAGIVNFVVLLMLFMVVASLLGMELFAYEVKSRYNFNNFLQAMLSVFLLLTNEGWNTMAYVYMHGMGTIYPVLYFIVIIIFGNFILLKLFIAILINNFHEASQEDEDPEEKEKEQKRTSTVTPEVRKQTPSIFQKSRGMMNSSMKQSQFVSTYVIQGKSLYLFSEENEIRAKIVEITHKNYFEFFILFVILFSSILLALDDPLSNSTNQVFVVLDIIITSIFILEAILKIIASGFLINGKDSYLRQPANILDMVVIIFSALNFDPNSSSTFSKVKVLRVIRVLRPLRLILRNEELKMAINALWNSLAQMLNITLIMMIFFLLFGIFGVTQFKGSYFHCDQDNINDKWQCWDMGGSWVNKSYNFDNVINAIITLFVMSTTEGWIGLMSDGIDSRGIDLNPIENNNQIWAFYFVFFIIVGSFFLLNLFAGVIVDAFLSEREKLKFQGSITEEEQDSFDLSMKIFISKPQVKYRAPQHPLLKRLYKLVNSSQFEIFVLLCIILNTGIMMIQFARQSIEVTDMILAFNWIFLAIFAIEAILKLVVYKSYYFTSGWNIFDFTVVLLTILGVILEQSNVLNNVGTATSILRTFRIFRVLRLVKSAKNLRIIFGTFLVTLPGLMSIGALLAIMLFIFSIIFMNLYPYIKYGDGITDFANFQSFGKSLFTLFKSSTGEDWNLIMADASRTIDPNNICFDISDVDGYNMYGLMGCGNAGSVVLMIVFQIVVTLIMLNLFVAIIIEGFSNTSKEENAKIKQADIEAFQNGWKDFDRDGKGFIYCGYFAQFMCLLPQPLGWKSLGKTPTQQRRNMSELELPVYQIDNKPQYYYYDVLNALSQYYLETQYQIFNFAIENEQAKQKLQIHVDNAMNKVSAFSTEFNSAHYMAVVMIQKNSQVRQKGKKAQGGEDHTIRVPIQQTVDDEVQQLAD